MYDPSKQLAMLPHVCISVKYIAKRLMSCSAGDGVRIFLAVLLASSSTYRPGLFQGFFCLRPVHGISHWTWPFESDESAHVGLQHKANMLQGSRADLASPLSDTWQPACLCKHAKA